MKMGKFFAALAGLALTFGFAGQALAAAKRRCPGLPIIFKHAGNPARVEKRG